MITLKTREVKTPSVIPIYGIGVVIILYSLFGPLYKLGHFFIEAAICVAAYFLLKLIFPGTVEIVEDPILTGDAKFDALLAEGDKAVKEMTKLRASINNEVIRQKIDTLIELTKKIFLDLLDDPNDYRQIKRFSDYFIPTTIKLLNSYNDFGSDTYAGDNAKTTMAKIEEVLDATIKAYHNQYDALFSNQALDIETDIEVLKTMLKREGLTDKDF